VGENCKAAFVLGTSFFSDCGYGGFMKLSRLSARDLEVQARVLETQIKKLDHRPRLTPSEHLLAVELKKKRLTLKDHLATAT
jgi:hypothetical protein